MRAKVVRQLRRLAYGSGHHPGPVVLFHHPKISGMFIADDRRQRYQRLKAAYKARNFTI